MVIAPLPPQESLRLQALYRLQILDTQVESVFDRLTELAAHLYGAEIALISLIDANRQWFKSCIGLRTRETSRDIAFCSHAILHNDVFLIADTLADERFADNPLVTGDPHIRFYLGAPLLTKDGHPVGTLCIIDRKPREASQVNTRPLRDLAALATHMIENRLLAEQLRASEKANDKTEETYQALVAEIPQIVFQLDAEARWAFLNPAWSELSGTSLTETLGRSWFDTVHPDERPRAKYFWDVLSSGPGRSRDTFHFFHRSGEPLWVEMSVRSIWSEESGLVGAVGTLHDVTERVGRQQNSVLVSMNAE